MTPVALLYVNPLSPEISFLASAESTKVPPRVGIAAVFALRASASNTAFCEGAIVVVPSLIASATVKLFIFAESTLNVPLL